MSNNDEVTSQALYIQNCSGKEFVYLVPLLASSNIGVTLKSWLGVVQGHSPRPLGWRGFLVGLMILIWRSWRKLNRRPPLPIHPPLHVSGQFGPKYNSHTSLVGHLRRGEVITAVQRHNLCKLSYCAGYLIELVTS